MKTTKAAKQERRARRKGADRPRGHLGPKLERRILRAVADFDHDAAWPTVAASILPVIKRVWHPYPLEASPIHIDVPPGIPTGFGIDLGPAFSHVTPDMIERWGIDRGTLLSTALANLARLVVREPPMVQRIEPDGVPVIAVSGQGWGSSLLLLPDVLRPILGPAPLTLIAPIRNTLLALPDDADLDLASDLWIAVAAGAHDELEVPPLRWNGRTVVGFGDRSVGLPN